MTTWSLELTDPATLQEAAAPPGPLEFRRAVRPSPELGRFLYTAAGGNWFWTMRLGWTFDQWLERLSQPRVETWVLYEDGTPAGYFELDGSIESDIEIAYLGVLPAFIGRRLGAWLLTTAIQRGFAMGGKRVWVHTCTLDSPNALANYRARGMRVFKEHASRSIYRTRRQVRGRARESMGHTCRRPPSAGGNREGIRTSDFSVCPKGLDPPTV